MDFLCACLSRALLMGNEALPSPHHSATYTWRAGPVLCQHSCLCRALCLPWGSSCPCMSHWPHAQNGHSLRRCLPSLAEIPLWWFTGHGWSFGEWSHLLTCGENTWIMASSKGIDWIHSSSISHHLLIMNTLGLFDSSLSCWHFLILLTILLQKQPDRTQMTVHWLNGSNAAALSSMDRVIVALKEHDYMCV